MILGVQKNFCIIWIRSPNDDLLIHLFCCCIACWSPCIDRCPAQTCIWVCMYTRIFMYVCLHMGRERERERESNRAREERKRDIDMKFFSYLKLCLTFSRRSLGVSVLASPTRICPPPVRMHACMYVRMFIWAYVQYYACHSYVYQRRVNPLTQTLVILGWSTVMTLPFICSDENTQLFVRSRRTIYTVIKARRWSNRNLTD